MDPHITEMVSKCCGCFCFVYIFFFSSFSLQAVLLKIWSGFSLAFATVVVDVKLLFFFPLFFFMFFCGIFHFFWITNSIKFPAFSFNLNTQNIPQQFALPDHHLQQSRPLISLIFRKHFRPSKQCTRSNLLHDVPVEEIRAKSRNLKSEQFEIECCIYLIEWAHGGRCWWNHIVDKKEQSIFRTQINSLTN